VDRQWIATRRLGVALGHRLHATSVSAPAARHGVDSLANDFRLLDGEITADRVVMKRTNSRCFDDVEASDVAARGATVSSSHHITVPVMTRRGDTLPRPVRPAEQMTPAFVVFVVARQTNITSLVKFVRVARRVVIRKRNLRSLEINHARERVRTANSVETKGLVRRLQDDDSPSRHPVEQRLLNVHRENVA